MSQQSASAPTRSASEAHRAPVDWRRLRGPAAVIALVALAVSSVGPSIAALLAGRLAEHPEGGLVAWLAVLLLGSAVLAACATPSRMSGQVGGYWFWSMFVE